MSQQGQGGWPPHGAPPGGYGGPPGGYGGPPGGYGGPPPPGGYGGPPGGYGGAPPGGYGGPGFPQQPWGPQHSNSPSSQAITAIVLAIASWMGCGCLTGLPAIFVARAELAAIERGESSPAGKQLAQAAFWVGVGNVVIFGIVMGIYGLIAVVALLSHAR